MELSIPHEDIILRQKQMISDFQHQLMLSEMGFKKLADENEALKRKVADFEKAVGVSQNQPEDVE